MKKLLTLIFVVLNVAYAYGHNNDEAIKQRISKAAQSMKTMQCNFTQTKYVKMVGDKMVSKGRMFYQQADKLRWEYQSPYVYTFVLNESKVLLKSRGRNDVIDVNRNKMFKEIARIMMSSVVGTCLTDEKSFKTSISTTSTEWIATLLPIKKNMKQMFQKIVLHFERQQNMVVKVELVEKNGDKTIIQLQGVKTNQPINAKVFSIN